MAAKDRRFGCGSWILWMLVNLVGWSLSSAVVWGAVAGRSSTQGPEFLNALPLIGLVLFIVMLIAQRALLLRQGCRSKQWLVGMALNLALGLFVTYSVMIGPSTMAGWSLFETSADALQWMTNFAVIGAVGGAIGGAVSGGITGIVLYT